jgi:hypothetical protein
MSEFLEISTYLNRRFQSSDFQEIRDIQCENMPWARAFGILCDVARMECEPGLRELLGREPLVVEKLFIIECIDAFLLATLPTSLKRIHH